MDNGQRRELRQAASALNSARVALACIDEFKEEYIAEMEADGKNIDPEVETALKEIGDTTSLVLKLNYITRWLHMIIYRNECKAR